MKLTPVYLFPAYSLAIDRLRLFVQVQRQRSGPSPADLPAPGVSAPNGDGLATRPSSRLWPISEVTPFDHVEELGASFLRRRCRRSAIVASLASLRAALKSS